MRVFAPHDVCEAALLSLVRAEFLFDGDGMFHRPVSAVFVDGPDGIPGRVDACVDRAHHVLGV